MIRRPRRSTLFPYTTLFRSFSFRYLRILPLHRKSHLPLPPSSSEVSNGLSQLGQELSHSTFGTACARFTPSKSGQRSQPTYYRGCWHVVSRCLFLEYRQSFFLEKSGLRPEGLHPARGVAASGFPPLRKIPNCCLP